MNEATALEDQTTPLSGPPVDKASTSHHPMPSRTMPLSWSRILRPQSPQGAPDPKLQDLSEDKAPEDPLTSNRPTSASASASAEKQRLPQSNSPRSYSLRPNLGRKKSSRKKLKKNVKPFTVTLETIAEDEALILPHSTILYKNTLEEKSAPKKKSTYKLSLLGLLKPLHRSDDDITETKKMKTS